MQNHDIGQLWEKILKITKPRIAEPIWETILQSSLLPVNFTNNTLSLYAVQDYIIKVATSVPNFIGIIEKAAFEASGEYIKVIIFSDSEQIENTKSSGTMTTMESSIEKELETNRTLLDDEIHTSEVMDLQDTIKQTTDYDTTYNNDVNVLDTVSNISQEIHEEKTFTSEMSEVDMFSSDYYEPAIVINPHKQQEHTSPVYSTKQTMDDTPIVIEQDDISSQDSNLNPFYTFETFVVGNTNRVAHAAAKTVAQDPASNYNPLFIYGDSGLGKTHLMHAIGNSILVKYPHMKVRCISSEVFMNDLITSIQKKRNEYFRNKYRNIDVLLVDDIQFIQSKQSTQTEFFHTFNTLQNLKKQIVLTSDTMPSNMKGIEKRLQSRFEGGYIVTIDTPDLETRIAILRAKADKELYNQITNQYEHQGYIMSRDTIDIIINTIASNVQNNVRTLEGSFTKVINTASVMKCEITTSFVFNLIKDVTDTTKNRHLDMECIQECISDYFKIKLEDLLGSKRKKHIAHARQIAMYLCRELINASYPSIADSFSKKDHTTIIHAYEKIDKERKNNEETRRYIDEIINLLKENCG